MRLALAGPFPPFRGGIAQFTDMLSSAFERYGDTVIRISYRRLYPSLLFPGRSQEDTESQVRIGAERLLDSVSPFEWRRSRRRLRAIRPDGILIQWWHPFFAPSTLGSIPPGIPTGAVCHNILPHESFPLGRLLTRKFLRRNGLIVAHSESDSSLAGSLAPAVPLIRLYLPVYEQYSDSPMTRAEARNRLGFGEDDRVLLFFGLIRTYKGLDDLIEATRLLEDRVKLLVVGECYSGRDSIEDALKESALEGRFTWIDSFVPDEDVAGYFRASDLVVLPYRHATQSAVAQTALGFRKPMIITDTGGLPEVVDEGSTGFLVPPHDPAALADGIRKGIELLNDGGLTGRVAGKAAGFGWDEYVRRIREVWP
jgi:glycosyltransferase involved in cell wall biosynthesis